VVVELQITGEVGPVVLRPAGPDLDGFAAFTVDCGGRVASWPQSAAALFGVPAGLVVGHDLRDVLLAGPDQRDRASHALAEVAAGRVWAGPLGMALAGAGLVAVRCEPLAGPGSGALVSVLRAQRGPGWLSDAVARIGSSLDLKRTADEVVGVAVPGFADAAVIFVPERMLAAGELAWHQARQATVVRRLAARLDTRPAAVTNGVLPADEVLILGEESPRFRAMADRRPVLFDGFDAGTAELLADRPGGRELAEEYTSFLVVPLVARDAVVGCLTFGRRARRPGFGPADLTAAGELASRAAVCLDNALLYDRERRTAQALQRGLLPGRPKVPAALQVAHRYLPVGDNVVGGDWHDIVSLPGGRAALIVGDAMGHGPEAAAVMVQLRTAAHVLADLDLPPSQVLGRLDTMAAGLATVPFAATCVYAIIDPSASCCQIAQAGHHPPVLVLPGGATQVLDLPPGLPLGLGAECFESSRVSLPPGATLALYTDGLVESRTRPLDQGMAALCGALGSALAAPRATLGSTCATVTQALRQHGEDDVTLVLARIRHP